MKTRTREQVETCRTGHRRGIYDQGLLVLAGIYFLFLFSCEHEPVNPIEPGPGDTTQNPIDTVIIDTLDGEMSGIPCSPDSVYFGKDILPLLRSNCAKSGCHDAASHEDDIILDSYSNVMSSDIIKPFNLNGSDLYEVITETDPDKVMPQPPNQKLTADQIALIAKWISQGAKDLTCNENAGQCDTTNVTYSGYVRPLLNTYCVGCHSGNTPSGGILLNSHGQVQTVALNGRLVGAISWANGYTPMPQGATTKLSDCKISKIQAWINDGAPNN
jgi:hypothetical protein